MNAVKDLIEENVLPTTEQLPQEKEISDGPEENNVKIDIKDLHKIDLVQKSREDFGDLGSIYLSYICDISKYPILLDKELKIISKNILKYKNSNNKKYLENINKLVISHLRLVVFLALKFKLSLNGTYLDIMDLINEGNLALLKAARTCDYTKGTKFSAYASVVITRDILEKLHKKRSAVEYPVHILAYKRRIRCALGEIKRNKGQNYDPTDKELAEKTNLPLINIKSAKKYACVSWSLSSFRDFGIKDTGFHYDGCLDSLEHVDASCLMAKKDNNLKRTLEQLQEDTKLHKEVDNDLINQKIRNIIEKYLDPQEKMVLSCIYGIKHILPNYENNENFYIKKFMNERGEYSYKERNKFLGVSRQRIDIVAKKALAKIKRHLKPFNLYQKEYLEE